MHVFLPSRVVSIAVGAWALTAIACSPASAQTTPPATGSNPPLHLLKSAYPAPYGPATSGKVNALGQVEGTCVGTGIITLLKTHRLEINDSAVQLYRRGPRS